MADKELNIDELRVDEMKEELKRLNLKVSGSRAVLRERLRTATRQTTELVGEGDEERMTGEDEEEKSGEDCEDDESSDSDGGEDDDDREDDHDRAMTTRKGARETRTKRLTLSFKDVEESLQTFSGDSKQNVQRWIEDFEETSEICRWTNAQKIIYAKKLLRGSAKLFVSYEKCTASWRKMRQSLVREFAKTVNSKSVHKELMSTRKQNDESYYEYMYRMMEIASHADIEFEAKVQYIIEGIPDEPMNKAILYGARNVRDLRKRLTQYETIKKNQRANQRGQSAKSGREVREVRYETSQKRDYQSTDARRCHNCGGKNHRAAECPYKDRGTRCFQCREFGHLAANCDKRGGAKQVNKCSIPIRYDNKIYKTVIVREIPLIALLDTGSDLHLIKADEYIKLGAPPLTGPAISCKSLSRDSISTLGSFVIDAVIDDNKYRLTIHVISDTRMDHSLLIGSDLLRDANIQLAGNNAIITKRVNETTTVGETGEIPEIFSINIDDTACEIDDIQKIDVRDVEDPAIKCEIKKLVENYKPQRTKETSVRMQIILKDEVPVYQRPRRLAPAERAKVNKQIEEWLHDGIVVSSVSEYASPVTLVKKKNGDTRLCIDYRKLNTKVIKDRYPLPLIDDQLDRLRDSILFSTLDLKDRFFHVPISEDSRKYTAFIVPDGHYEFLRAPFGLCNSPAMFQKFINTTFRNLINNGTVLTYLDDLIVPSRDEAEGLNKLRDVLIVASEHGLNINWDKCHFLKKRIEYLGHIIERGSVRPSEDKTRAVMSFPIPANTKQIQSFLGLTGYFRKFIPSYSEIAYPLSELLKKDVKFRLDDEQKHAFQELKNVLSREPVLKLYRVEADTELHTDASSRGFGAILCQRDDESQRFHPVYYASWKTSEAESKYSSYELEVLAIIRALNKFRVYLLGIPFKIITDCRAFSLTMSKKDLCVRVARWALLLEEFDYTIQHRSGSAMRHVDALSRNPPEVMSLHEDNSSLIARLSHAQCNDETLKSIIQLVRNGDSSDYVLQRDVLYKNCDGDLLFVVPKAMQVDVIKQMHEKGHFARGKVEQLLKREFWFQRMREKIDKVIRNCITCILAERKHGKQEGFLRNIPKQIVPLDMYHIDHLGPIPSTRKSYAHILVVVDSFTKFTWLYPTKSTSAEETITRLTKQASVFGNPRRIVSDRGTAFTSKLFQNYCASENIEHVLITAGVPRGNGQVERMNRIVIPVLTKLSAPHPENWYKFVESVQQYINASVSRSTGLTPFELLIGKTMRLKEDIELKRILEDETIRLLQEERETLREQAKNAIEKIQEENRRVYNRKRKRALTYSVGDLIAIKRTQIPPGSKLYPKYLGPYKVTRVLRGDRYAVAKIGEHEGPRVTTTSVDNMKRWLTNNDETNSELSDEDNASDIERHRSPMPLQDGRDVGTAKRSSIITRARSAVLRRSKLNDER